MHSNYRYEIKFILDESKLADAIQWLNNSTTALRSYKNRKVNSIYFDDLIFSSVKDNLSGIPIRKKLRLRWYSNQENEYPKFEIKTKNGRLGKKITFPIESIDKNIMELDLDTITSRCIDSLKVKNIFFDDHILPSIQIDYEREYFETSDDIRITIDHNIQFYDTQINTKLNKLTPYSYSGHVMEIKFAPEMKNQVAKLIKPLNISPKRHSKYLIGLAKLGYVVYI